MPDTPVSPSVKNTAPVANHPKAEAPAASATNTEVAAPAPKISSALPIVLGLISAILLVLVFVDSKKVSARDQALVESHNRLVQVESGTSQLQKQVDEAKAAT